MASRSKRLSTPKAAQKQFYEQHIVGFVPAQEGWRAAFEDPDAPSGIFFQPVIGWATCESEDDLLKYSLVLPVICEGDAGPRPVSIEHTDENITDYLGVVGPQEPLERIKGKLLERIDERVEAPGGGSEDVEDD